jgi:hypothetical protein
MAGTGREAPASGADSTFDRRDSGGCDPAADITLFSAIDPRFEACQEAVRHPRPL